MQFGNGALIFQGLPTPPTPPGPPFPANSAVDGCSVDPITGQIVWGNDVGLTTAILLSDRELPMGAFKVTWLRGANRQFQIDPATHRYFIGDRDNSAGGIYFAIDSPAKTVKVFDQGNAIPDLLMDFTNQLYVFGSSGLGFPSALTIDNTAAQEIDLLLSGNSYLRLNSGPLKTYEIGDLDGSNNFCKFKIDDSVKIATVELDLSTYMSIDGINKVARFGGNLNANALIIDAINDFSEMRINNNRYLSLDGINLIYAIGDVDLTVNGQQLWINDNLSVSALGDVFGVNNGTLLTVDDTSQIIHFDAINGVIINTTGTINDNGTSMTLTPGGGNLIVQGAPGQTIHFLDFIQNGAVQSSYFGSGGGLKILGEIANNYVGSGPEIEENGAGQGVLRSFNRGGGVYQDWLIDGLNILIRPNGTVAGTFGAVNALTLNGDTTLIHTTTALSSNAGANVGTLTNAPTVGNPSKWIAIDDNGTIRKIPTWL